MDTQNRFEFGKNWKNFLSVLDEDRIKQAEISLIEMLGFDDLSNKSFLDIGSGSGLFSLAARRLGANVYSFDYDSESVACTAELKRRYFPDDDNWNVEQGSALDFEYINALDHFDIVYSWGVLHHTGAMWVGIEHAISRVKHDGLLYLALYNDQGWKSHFWWFIKFVYNKLPSPLNLVYGYVIGFLAKFLILLKYTFLLKPMTVLSEWFNYRKNRGMSILHDMIDWVGGYPFEFVTYETLDAYMHSRGFSILKGEKASSLGCHKMVFKRMDNKQ
ncbi:MAG TPA: class I SAM-dependent methyltransferase [Oligoflexia bacterium]|nr:class I SAM-dependent methyltransferase [Oligoflexia bacterium]HMP48566.1 class I SAM-dependent methyltransferase [Oligoflexia bacterium]